MTDQPHDPVAALAFLGRGVVRELRDRLGDQRAGQSSSLRDVHDLADMRERAQRARPRSVLDFVEGAAPRTR